MAAKPEPTPKKRSAQSGAGESAKQRDLYKSLVESSKDVLWAMDLSLAIIYVSPSIEEFLGWTPEEYRALPPSAILIPESLAAAKRAHAALYTEAAAGASTGAKTWQSYEALHLRKDGRLVWGEVSVSLLLDEEGVPRGFHQTSRPSFLRWRAS